MPQPVQRQRHLHATQRAHPPATRCPGFVRYDAAACPSSEVLAVQCESTGSSTGNAMPTSLAGTRLARTTGVIKGLIYRRYDARRIRQTASAGQALHLLRWISSNSKQRSLIDDILHHLTELPVSIKTVGQKEQKISLTIFSRVHETLQPALSVGRSVGPMVRHTLLFL